VTRAIAAVWLAGCSFSPVDLSGRECPCLEAWVCDARSNTCVRAEGADAGRPRDAGGRDSALREDAGELDAGTVIGDEDAGEETDAGEIDAGDELTLCQRRHASALFCDGFEDAGLDAWDRADTEPGATTRRATSPIFDGSGSLRVQTGDGYSVAAMHKEVFPLMSSGDLWVRSYYFLPTESVVEAVEFAGLSSFDGTEELVIFAGEGVSDFHCHGYCGDIRQDMTIALERDRWLCIEQHVRFDATDGLIEVFVNGDLVGTRGALDTTSRGGLTTIEAGIVWQEQPGTTIYVDEVVGDTSRIGCE
jgi:hypothetical protein